MFKQLARGWMSRSFFSLTLPQLSVQLSQSSKGFIPWEGNNHHLLKGKTVRVSWCRCCYFWSDIWKPTEDWNLPSMKQIINKSNKNWFFFFWSPRKLSENTLKRSNLGTRAYFGSSPASLLYLFIYFAFIEWFFPFLFLQLRSSKLQWFPILINFIKFLEYSQVSTHGMILNSFFPSSTFLLSSCLPVLHVLSFFLSSVHLSFVAPAAPATFVPRAYNPAQSTNLWPFWCTCGKGRRSKEKSQPVWSPVSPNVVRRNCQCTGTDSIGAEARREEPRRPGGPFPGPQRRWELCWEGGDEIKLGFGGRAFRGCW